MPAASLPDLSPAEKSFFDEGEALDIGGGEPGQARHRSRRQTSRQRLSRRWRSFRRTRWRTGRVVSVVLTIVAIYAGYYLSMAVASH